MSTSGLCIESTAQPVKAVLAEMLPNFLDDAFSQIVPACTQMQYIPYDIKKEIVSFLGIVDCHHLCLSCKAYAAIFGDQQYWKARTASLGFPEPNWPDVTSPFVRFVGVRLPSQSLSIKGSELYYTTEHCLKSAISQGDAGLLMYLLREEPYISAEVFSAAVKRGNLEMVKALYPLTLGEDSDKVLFSYVTAGSVEVFLYLLRAERVLLGSDDNLVPLIKLIESDDADKWEYSLVFMSAARYNMIHLFSRFLKPEPHTFVNRAATVAARYGSKEVLIECLRHITDMDATATYLTATRYHQLAMADLIATKRKVRAPIASRQLAILKCPSCRKAAEDIVPTTSNMSAVLDSGREDLFIELLKSMTCKPPEVYLSSWLRIAFKRGMFRAAECIAAKMEKFTVDDLLPLIKKGDVMRFVAFAKQHGIGRGELKEKEQKVIAEAAVASGSSQMILMWAKEKELVNEKHMIAAATKAQCAEQVGFWLYSYPNTWYH